MILKTRGIPNVPDIEIPLDRGPVVIAGSVCGMAFQALAPFLDGVFSGNFEIPGGELTFSSGGYEVTLLKGDTRKTLEESRMFLAKEALDLMTPREITNRDRLRGQIITEVFPELSIVDGALTQCDFVVDPDSMGAGFKSLSKMLDHVLSPRRVCIFEFPVSIHPNSVPGIFSIISHLSHSALKTMVVYTHNPAVLDQMRYEDDFDNVFVERENEIVPIAEDFRQYVGGIGLGTLYRNGTIQ